MPFGAIPDLFSKNGEVDIFKLAYSFNFPKISPSKSIFTLKKTLTKY